MAEIPRTPPSRPPGRERRSASSPLSAATKRAIPFSPSGSARGSIAPRSAATRATAAGIYFITHGPDGHRFSYLRKDSAAAHFGPADLPDALIGQARFLFASGISLAISPLAADAVFAAIAIARNAGAKVAIDTNHRPALWPPARAASLTHAAIARADIALPSLEDATSLTGLTDPDAILDFYLGLGPPLVVLKRGAAGAILATKDRRLVLPGLRVSAVDPTGAGDVFCGCFLARLLAGDAPDAAARYAVAAAALSTTGYGAVAPIPRPADIAAVMAPAA